MIENKNNLKEHQKLLKEREKSGQLINHMD